MENKSIIHYVFRHLEVDGIFHRAKHALAMPLSFPRVLNELRLAIPYAIIFTVQATFENFIVMKLEYGN